MISGSLSPTIPPPQLVVGAETETQGLLTMIDQDGEDDEDVPGADGGFFVHGEMGGEDNGVTSQSTATEEDKPNEAHDVKFKASPCRPNSVEVAKHDKTHLTYRN